MTIQTRTHDPANQISGINGISADVGYDPAGNMSKLPRVTDNAAAGHYVAVYDAWNRLIKLQSDEATPTVYATFAYDGRGRRIGKAVSNSGNWNCVYHYYLDGDSMIEVRNGSDLTIKQQVWGLSYIDELVQQGINSSPSTQSTCDTFYWACQDANYNVNLLVDGQGYKIERYAYSPYGQRTAYKAADLGDSQLMLAIGSSQAVQVGGVDQPYGLCEFGHQGLMLDEESGIYDNRRRPYVPEIGRFPVRDPIGYGDGMNWYQYLGSSPISFVDWTGLKKRECQIAIIAGIAPVWEEKWNMIGVIPGRIVHNDNNFGTAHYRGIYMKRYWELLYCCDDTDAGYFKWTLRAISGYADAGRPNETAPIIGAAAPAPFPIGYGQAIDISPFIKDWPGGYWTWAIGFVPSWDGHPPAPTSPLAGPDPVITDQLGNRITPVASVTCSCGLASTGAGAGTAGVPVGARPKNWPPRFPKP